MPDSIAFSQLTSTFIGLMHNCAKCCPTWLEGAVGTHGWLARTCVGGPWTRGGPPWLRIKWHSITIDWYQYNRVLARSC